MQRHLAKLLLACGALAFASRATARPFEPPFDLFEAGPMAQPEGLGSSLGDWALLHREEREEKIWLLLALRDGGHGGDLPGWGRPRYLGRVREGERVVYSAPEEGQERLRTGRPVTISPAGGTVSVTREAPATLAHRAPHQFRLLERALPSKSVRDRMGPSPELARTLERAGRAGPRTDDNVRELVAQVSIDSLESYVRALSENASSGSSTNRYYSSDETEIVHRLTIETKFAESLGPGAISEHAFEMDVPGSNSITVHNIVAKLEAAVPATGAILVTAHYDAIGLRSEPDSLCFYGYRDPSSGCDCNDPGSVGSDPDCEWNWRTDPAPGADDNASGVALLLEAARILKDVPFEFDLYFVAFQGEELGLLGSAAFADSIAESGQEVFAVVNMDMVAHSLSRRQLDIVANEGSEWLADFLVETGAMFVPDLPVTKFVEFFGRSDHASFWSVGIDAVLLIEDKRVVYPRYHTFQDTWEAINETRSRDQFELAGELVVGTLARLAVQYEDPDLAIPLRELVVTPVSGNDVRAGRRALITTRVFNYGSSSLSFEGNTTDSLTARVSVYDGDPNAGGRLLDQETRKTLFAYGGFEEFETIWEPAVGEEGFHEIHAVVEGLDPGYAERELTAANNRGSSEIFVGGSAPRILMHYSYPNPLREEFSGLSLCYDLTADAAVRVSIYDLEGALVAQFFADSNRIDDGNRTGRNTIHGTQFRDDADRHVSSLEAGVYLYAIRLLDGSGEVSDAARGKFAVVH